MKKIFMTLSAGAMLSAAIILGGCNNAEEVKKQTDAQNAAIQALVDTKLSGLQDLANAECNAQVDSLAKIKFEEWTTAEAKGKKGSKPKPKPEPKKEVKKEEPKKKGFGGQIDDKQSKPKGFGGQIEQQKDTTVKKKKGFGGQISPK